MTTGSGSSRWLNRAMASRQWLLSPCKVVEAVLSHVPSCRVARLAAVWPAWVGLAPPGPSIRCMTDSQLTCTRLVIFLVQMLKTLCLSYLNVHTGERYDHALMEDFPLDFSWSSFLYFVPWLYDSAHVCFGTIFAYYCTRLIHFTFGLVVN
jgi:hypothetical protein